MTATPVQSSRTPGRSVDVCVIGGGLLGTATAFFAARAGLSVTVLEARDLASGASGAAFGGVSVGIYSYSSARVPKHYVDISKASLALFEALAEELGPPLDLKAPGSLDPYFDPATHPSRIERAEGLKACGVDCQLLTPKEVLELEPAVNPAVVGATYCPADAHVTPLNAVWAFAGAARRHGAEIRTQSPVDEILVEGGRAVGVRLGEEKIFAGHVVNTAGADAPALAEAIGIRIPMDCSRGQMFVTERVPRLLNTYIHNIKQTPSGTIVYGATRESGEMEVATTPEGTRQVNRWACLVLPALADIAVLRSWAGIRPVPADGYPVIGPVEGVENLLVAVMHRGVTLAPIVGKILFDLIVEGATDIDIEPYRLSRFWNQDPAATVAVEESYYAKK
jgi:glycine/D-amino acid oxidase-like deaminating enzyme